MGGGGTVWGEMAYDPDADFLYIGTAKGGPWNQNLHSPGRGDNLLLPCVLVGEAGWQAGLVFPGDSRRQLRLPLRHSRSFSPTSRPAGGSGNPASRTEEWAFLPA